ncbi:MAG: hypothetical protein ACT4OJ_10135 [Bacteroidota bacterium]
MACTIIVTLTEIQHAGSDIGDDWNYTATVNGDTRRIDGSGYGKPGDRITINETWRFINFECGSVVNVQISLKAEEEDLLFDDRGAKAKTIVVTCPDPQPPPLTGYFSFTDDIVVVVKERPSFLLGQSNVTFKFKFEAICS